MKVKSWNEIRKAATKFSNSWKTMISMLGLVLHRAMCSIRGIIRNCGRAAQQPMFLVTRQSNSTFGIQRPNNWPTRTRWTNRWLHSDMKDVSYFFNFKFYEKVIEKGGLR